MASHVGSSPPSNLSRSPHIQERSRNAIAQARHRAKRKAYIEQLEETVTRLQQALNVAEGRGPPIPFQNPLRLDHSAYYDHDPTSPIHSEVTSPAVDTRAEAARVTALEIENRSLRGWAQEAKAHIDRAGIPIRPIPPSSFLSPDSRLTSTPFDSRMHHSNNAMFGAGPKRRRSESIGSVQHIGQDGSFEDDAVRNIASSTPRPSATNVSTLGPPFSSAPEPTSAHPPVAGLDMTGRQLPPVPSQRPHYSFAQPESRTQSASIADTRRVHDEYSGVDESSNRWVPPLGTNQSQQQGEYGQVQVQRHLQHTSRFANGQPHQTRETARDRYAVQDDSQPSTPASLASMPPPHPRMSPTNLNVNGSGMHLPPPDARVSGGGLYSQSSQNIETIRPSDLTSGTGTGYLTNGRDQGRRIAENGPNFKTEETGPGTLQGGVYPPHHKARVPSTSSVYNESTESPTLSSANVPVTATPRHYHYHQNGTSGSGYAPTGVPGQGSGFASFQASAPHSPYTPTSAGPGSFRQSMPPSSQSISENSGPHDEYSRWSDSSYGR